MTNELPVYERLNLVAHELEALFPHIMPYFSDEEAAGDMVAAVITCTQAACVAEMKAHSFGASARHYSKVEPADKRQARNKAKAARRARRKNR